MNKTTTTTTTTITTTTNPEMPNIWGFMFGTAPYKTMGWPEQAISCEGRAAPTAFSIPYFVHAWLLSRLHETPFLPAPRIADHYFVTNDAATQTTLADPLSSHSTPRGDAASYPPSWTYTR
jgi:hypothetical protein